MIFQFKIYRFFSSLDTKTIMPLSKTSIPPNKVSPWGGNRKYNIWKESYNKKLIVRLFMITQIPANSKRITLTFFFPALPILPPIIPKIPIRIDIIAHIKFCRF